MEMTLIYTIVGFALAGYSVIGNDSIQTLGTFIASKDKSGLNGTLLLLQLLEHMAITITLWMGLECVWMVIFLTEDLHRIPYQEIQWYHAVAPGILLLLTRIGIPVSTTFLVLSAFASTVVLRKNAYEKRSRLWSCCSYSLYLLDSNFKIY